MDSCQSATDWFFNWVDAWKKQVYANGGLSEKLLWFRKTPEKEPSLATVDRYQVYLWYGKYSLSGKSRYLLLSSMSETIFEEQTGTAMEQVTYDI